MIIAFTTQKGGIGKTTSTSVVSCLLKLAGYRVLVVDTDAQANATRYFGIKQIEKNEELIDLYCSTVDKEKLKSFIMPTNFEDIDIIPSSKLGLEDTLINDRFALEIHVNHNTTVELCLKKNLELLKDDYDYIVIDSAPGTDHINRSVIAASDKVFMPIFHDGFSFDGIDRCISLVAMMKEKYDLSVEFGGIFMVRTSARTLAYKHYKRLYENAYKEKFIDTPIRSSNALPDSNTAGVSILTYDKRCMAIADYAKFTVATGLITDKKHYNKLIAKLK